MNTYLVGMIITLVLYVIIGALISRSVKNANDFYVAGRNAPAYLITGSLVASFIGVGLSWATSEKHTVASLAQS